MKTITIKGKEYKIKYSLRAMFIFEAIKQEPFKIETLLDNYVFLYAMILANNPDNVLNWDDFIDTLDNDPKIYKELMEILNDQEAKNRMYDSIAQENAVEGENGEKKN